MLIEIRNAGCKMMIGHCLASETKRRCKWCNAIFYPGSIYRKERWVRRFYTDDPRYNDVGGFPAPFDRIRMLEYAGKTYRMTRRTHRTIVYTP